MTLDLTSLNPEPFLAVAIFTWCLFMVTAFAVLTAAVVYIKINHHRIGGTDGST